MEHHPPGPGSRRPPRRRTRRLHQAGLPYRLAGTLTCPHGITSPPWKPTPGDGHARLSVLFPRKACRECDDRLSCTGTIDGKGRHIFLLPQAQQEIQTRVRQEQTTHEWRERFALRAGCEATVSETVHAHGLRTCRYRGTEKTHVQHVLTAAGTNVIRLSQRPDRQHRSSTPFHRLCQSLNC
ncbi:transposase [Streptacidiphilus sp. N1-10]|uniref:Transposase n=1 Tax=Streptacidiphilus jeojiensis TaxID=3229225 RepID=A0ABV6XJM6_9ACTN